MKWVVPYLNRLSRLSEKPPSSYVLPRSSTPNVTCYNFVPSFKFLKFMISLLHPTPMMTAP
jgi:hypothetical protein